MSDDRTNEHEDSENDFYCPGPSSLSINERISQQFEPKYFRAEQLKLESGTVIKRQRPTGFEDSESENDIKIEPGISQENFGKRYCIMNASVDLNRVRISNTDRLRYSPAAKKIQTKGRERHAKKVKQVKN